MLYLQWLCVKVEAHWKFNHDFSLSHPTLGVWQPVRSDVTAISVCQSSFPCNCLHNIHLQSFGHKTSVRNTSESFLSPSTDYCSVNMLLVLCTHHVTHCNLHINILLEAKGKEKPRFLSAHGQCCSTIGIRSITRAIVRMTTWSLGTCCWSLYCAACFQSPGASFSMSASMKPPDMATRVTGKINPVQFRDISADVNQASQKIKINKS